MSIISPRVFWVLSAIAQGSAMRTRCIPCLSSHCLFLHLPSKEFFWNLPFSSPDPTHPRQHPWSPCPDALNRLMMQTKAMSALPGSPSHHHLSTSHIRSTLGFLPSWSSKCHWPPCTFLPAAPTQLSMLTRGQISLCQLLLSIPHSIRELQGPQETKGEQGRSSSLQLWRAFRKAFSNFTLCPF